jgi:hypothetical protein
MAEIFQADPSVVNLTLIFFFLFYTAARCSGAPSATNSGAGPFF